MSPEHLPETSTPNPRGGAFTVDGWVVDPATSRIARDGETLQLEPKVMEVLEYLARRAGHVVSRAELEATVWRGRVVSYDAVTNAIIKLRKAFNDDPRQPKVIETLSKKGYRLLALVQPVDGSSETGPTSDGELPATASQGQWRLAGAAALLISLVIGVAAVLAWISPWQRAHKAAPENVVATADTSLRSIAVLPFDNLSGDVGQEYFADGITDDLITGLAKSRDLLVIARDSTFRYKGQAIDVRRVADKLNVRFILHGSVRRVGDEMRVNAQLVDAKTQSLLWADSYDGRVDGMLDVQGRIAQSIVSTLSGKVSTGERQDLGLPLTGSPEAYDNFLKGRQHFYRYLNKAENQKARAYFQTAIEFDPNFAMAYAMLAWTHAFDVMNGWSDHREQSLQLANNLSAKAITLQQDLPLAYFVAGLAYRERGEYVKALVEAQKATEYDPNYANAHVLVATLLYYAGRPQEGLDRIKKAMRLNPHHPYNYTFHLGQAYYILGRYQEAIEALKEGIESNPASERLHLWLAAAYAQAGAVDDAKWEAEQVLTLNPNFSLERIQHTFPFKDSADREHFLDGLRKAGFTE